MSQFISPMSYIYQIFPALLSIIGNVHECINRRYDNYKPNMHWELGEISSYIYLQDENRHGI